MRTLLSTLTLLSALAAGARAQDEGGEIELTSMQPFEGRLAVDGPNSMCFVLDVPLDVVALELRLFAPLVDLDLGAHPGEHLDDLEQAAWLSVEDEGEEGLLIQRLGDAALAGGPLYVCVDYAYEYAPLVNGRPLESAGFRLEARVHRARVDAELELGRALASTLEAASGGFRTFALDVPAGAGVLRLDLFDAEGDLDLFARHRVRVLSHGPLTALAQNPWGAETLLITPDSKPPLATGRWFVQVANLVDGSEPARFSILASLQREPPAELLGLPQLTPGPEARGLARALPAVFELFRGPFGGSGTCISADGWILTNAHVVETGGDEDVVICATTARGSPARESFLGEVVELDRERDLALVRVVSGFRGEPIPEDYVFPAVPLGDPEALRMGQGLLLAGYPTTGGSRSRVSVSLSRGIVSGFERSAHGLLIKTDAELEGGSSGGAALDEQGRLVGVPSSKVELGSGHFGFVQPLSAVPAAWMARVTRGAQR